MTTLPANDESWQVWLAATFPSYVRAGFAPRHMAFWDWVWRLRPGVRPPPFIGIWPRGGGKSTSAELACVTIGARRYEEQLIRPYVLYVSETQEQADKHEQNVAGLLERIGIMRALNKYGASKGWRRNQLRTADGFKVDALGLDTASRGAKVDEDRPGLIVLDDIDDKHDTPRSTHKKIELITMSILPAGASDLAVLGMQNLIHAHSIFARLTDGRADFLSDRVVSGPHRAIEGLSYIPEGNTTRIFGMPTWQGQDLNDCQGLVNTIGITAFLSECQHEVGRLGMFFDAWDPKVHVVAPFAIPDDWLVWAALDHGHNHPTACYFFAKGTDGIVYVIAEHVVARKLPPWHAEQITLMLTKLGITKSRLRSFVAGRDIFDQRADSQGLTIAEQYAQAKTPDKVHVGLTLTRADVDRVNGAAAVRTRIGRPADGMPVTLKVFSTCPRLIACLPQLIADPARPEDVLKVDAVDGHGGDDEYDALRYGIMATPKSAVVLPKGALAGAGVKGWTCDDR